DGDDRLGIRIELNVVTSAVPPANRATQTRDTLRYGVAVRAWPLRSLRQLVHDVFGCGSVRVAHTEIDDVVAAFARCSLELADNVEHIGRQTADSGKFSHG